MPVLSAIACLWHHLLWCLLSVAVVASVCLPAQGSGQVEKSAKGDVAANPAEETPATDEDKAPEKAGAVAARTVPAGEPACPADSSEPCITGPSTTGPCIDAKSIPRFVENSPFTRDGPQTQFKPQRRLWATSWLWSEAPKLVVERWLTDQPELEGKYVLIEFWATWCPPCRRSLAVLNRFHEKYGEELVVIGICEEDEGAVRTLRERHPQAPDINFFSAVDTRKRMKDQLEVWGIPHAILLEPDGYVIWEGFPLQPGYELTDETIERILAVGRKLRAEQPPETSED